MSIERGKKLKNLLANWPSGMVATSKWLQKQSISNTLAQRYLKSGWLESLGKGAYKRAGDSIHWHGALSSLQDQLGMEAHVGGPTALLLKGRSQYLRLGQDRAFIFIPTGKKLPKWFLEHSWGYAVEPVHTTVLPAALGLEKIEYEKFPLIISSSERAILECLYLSPNKMELLECYQLMEGMLTLRPDLMQDLLQQCNSIKVKRLFLYMANKAKLPVLNHLDPASVDLGSGDRSVVKNGVYISEYKITVPQELADYA